MLMTITHAEIVKQNLNLLCSCDTEVVNICCKEVDIFILYQCSGSMDHCTRCHCLSCRLARSMMVIKVIQLPLKRVSSPACTVNWGLYRTILFSYWSQSTRQLKCFQYPQHSTLATVTLQAELNSEGNTYRKSFFFLQNIKSKIVV